jgi:hypothetical protein
MELRVEEALISALNEVPNLPSAVDPEWLTLLMPNIDAEFHLFTVYLGESIVAWFPHWVRKHLGLLTVVNPYPFYYTCLITNLPPRKLHQDRQRLHLQILRTLAIELKKRYHRTQINLRWETTDIRGFQWEGYTAIPCYTLINRLDSMTVETMTPGHRTEYRTAERSALEFVENTDVEGLVRLMSASYQRQNKQLAVAQETLSSLVTSALNHPSAHLFSVLRAGSPIAAELVQIDARHEIGFGLMTGFDITVSCGAGVFLKQRLFERLQESCKLFDMCGANTPMIAQFKAGFGGELTPFFQLKYSRLRIR